MTIATHSLRTWLVGGAVALLSVGCHAGHALPPETLDSPAARLFNGYSKPNVKCYSCHNGDGHGANGPNLSERVPKLSDEGLLSAINEGPSYMPSYRDDLTDAEKRELVSWLRQRFGKPTK
jgi:mono/diheme cytochrome c family protein